MPVVSDQSPSVVFNSLVTSIIRTVVPSLAGLIFGWLVSINFSIPGVSEPLLEGVLTFAFGAVYYFGVRLLEQKWPKLGWLLGRPVQPVYPVTPPPVIGVDTGVPTVPPVSK